MKLTFVALNSKYIHAALAPWYLKAACAHLPVQTQVLDMCINQPVEDLLRAIADTQPDAVGFSCYIFNIGTVQRLLPALRRLLPSCFLFAGGPEVSFDAEERLARMPQLDAVISGEGEGVLPALIGDLLRGKAQPLPGLTLRTAQGIAALPAQNGPALAALPSPYTAEMLRAQKGKISYYEASRGCPYRCSYCLSHLSHGVRHQDMPRIQHELLLLANSGARQIKFVDRTFNCSPARALDIWQFLLAEYGKGIPAHMNFHFEAAPDLFTPEMFTLLARAPKGYFQLEIGIQSFLPETLQAVHRSMDIPKCKENIRRLLALGNMHIHIDLIAGLPGETLAAFRQSFNEAFVLQPHCLQLGFLKLLKGAQMRTQADTLGYIYDPEPPYEVLTTPWLSYADLGELKLVEWACERYYNSGRFAFTLQHALASGAEPYALLLQLGQAAQAQGLIGQGISAARCSALLLQVLAPQLGSAAENLLKMDWLCTDNTGDLPRHLHRAESPAVKAAYQSAALPPPFTPGKDLRRNAHIEAFTHGAGLPGQGESTLLITARTQKDPITGRYAWAWLKTE